MNIREIRANELGLLLELYQHLHEDDEPLPNQNVVDEVWQKIQVDDHLIYLGAYEQENLLGSCTLAVIPNLTRACKPYGVIENVVTHKDFRRKGIGQGLLRKALDHAWSGNCYKVMLLTGRLNEGAFKFYESAGFDRHSKQAFVARPVVVGG